MLLDFGNTVLIIYMKDDLFLRPFCGGFTSIFEIIVLLHKCCQLHYPVRYISEQRNLFCFLNDSIKCSGSKASPNDGTSSTMLRHWDDVIMLINCDIFAPHFVCIFFSQKLNPLFH